MHKHARSIPALHRATQRMAMPAARVRPGARRKALLPRASGIAASDSATTASIYFRTNWSKAWIHGAVNGGSWNDIPLHKVSSAPGQWLVAHVEAGASNGKPLLEFVVTDKQNSWNKPEQGNYIIPSPGRYTVQGGAVQVVAGQAVMVVSDLDGTMVGDDGATAQFKSFWEEVAVVRGGVLVYNTGRALPSFEALLREKARCMAHPDALISAVGTKVYRLEGGAWHEDEQWSATLDEGWRVTAVRDACYKALAAAGKELMHFRPADEQNDHKVTCGVNVSALDQVLASVNATLADADVTANVITSGSGDWRYLDLVPIKAGKLQALEYVRKLYGFPIERTVACGDSGNDILMLAGENPAIVVGNAQSDLLRWVEEQRRKEPEAGPGGKQRLFVATKKEALGILEGLERLGLK